MAQPVPSAPGPTPSVLRLGLADACGIPSGATGRDAAILRAPPVQNKQDDHCTTQEPSSLDPGTPEPLASASWVRRLVARLLDMGVLVLLLPQRLRHRPVLILGSVAMDMMWHARSPGQTLGKRLLRLQVCASSTCHLDVLTLQ